MQVQDVMTQYVISVSPDDTIAHAVRLMLQEHISGLPVIDADGRLVGVVTEGDFLRRAETGTQRKRPRWLAFLTSPGRMAEEYVHAHSRKVGDVMTDEPLTVTEETPLTDAVAEINRYRSGRVILMNDELARQRISGRFTIQDTDQAIALIQQLYAAHVRRVANVVMLG